MPLRTYSIGQVSEKLDVSCHTLRFWEKALGDILVPLRTNGGQRRYTDEHLRIILLIKGLRNMGLSIAQIRERLCEGEGLRERNTEIIDQVAEQIAQIVRLALNNFITKNH